MSSPPKPSFRETPSKTTIFAVKFRKKTGVPRSTEPFSEVGIKASTASFPTRKRQRISNENLALLLGILHFGLFATRRESTGNISASQTLNLIPPHNLTFSEILRIFDLVLDTPARQCSNKFDIALAYSHFGFAEDTPPRKKCKRTCFFLSAYSYL